MANLTRRVDQPFVSLRDAMNQLFADAFTPSLWGQGFSQPNGHEALPPVNVYEDGDKFYLLLLAPGVDAEAVEVTAANGVLTISGRQRPMTQESWRTVWQEFGTTEFRRQLRMPAEIEAGKIEARYQNGVLMITVPKAEHVKPKTIMVDVSK